MKANAVFTKGYSTGATKDSISVDFDSGSGHVLGFTVGPETPHAPFLEFGTSRMEAQPFIKPTFEAISEDLVDDLKALGLKLKK